MLNRHLTLILASFISLIPMGCTGIDKVASVQPSNVRFYCGTAERSGQVVQATIVETPDLKEAHTLIYWDPRNSYFGEKWTPEKRCAEVSKRFQSLYERDSLKYLTADTAKWVDSSQINVVCSVKEKSEATRCQEDDLLITLQGNDDPNKVLQDIVNLRKPSSAKPLTRGGKSAETFSEGKRVFYDLSELKLDKGSVKSNTPEKSIF